MPDTGSVRTRGGVLGLASWDPDQGALEVADNSVIDIELLTDFVSENPVIHRYKMVAPRATQLRPPSKWWLVVSAVISLLAAAALAIAIVYQVSSTQPIGEGSVFREDAAAASEMIRGSASPADGVTHARNRLGVEAVSLVDPSGKVTASTSDTLAGVTLVDPLLRFGVESGRLTALAISVDEPIEIDGVVEWPPGSVLYHLVTPLVAGEGFVMVHYDVAELLARRAQPGDIRPLTLELLALSGVFAILGGVVLMGHSRAARRHRELVAESEMLRTHSRELEEANAKLAAARRKAERALALAEEKMRIRSEFVLMINHELRTPLTSVVTGAELLQDETLSSEELAEVIDSMVSNGKRLNEIIDQILAVARIENRGFVSELATVPLKEACTAVRVDGMGDFADPNTVSVLTDVRTLRLVIASLADNARTHGASHVVVRCSPEPTIEPLLELGDRPQSSVFFTVSDDGPGIDLAFLPRAFEKFEKNSFSSGTGLGLYMVRLMVDGLGGSVGVDTTPKGTTFQIALPAQVSDRTMEPV